MPRSPVAILVGLIALALASCASLPADKPPPTALAIEVSRPVPESSKAPCPGPVEIPDKDLTAGEVVELWAQDRNALAECETKRRGAVQ